MSDVCALEGCAEPLEPQPDGTPPRKYCCQRHRTAARARRAAARREQEQPAAEWAAETAGHDPAPAEPDVDPVDDEWPERRDDEEPAFQRIGVAVRRVVDEDDDEDDDEERGHEDTGRGGDRAGGEVDALTGRESASAEGTSGAGASRASSTSSSAVSRHPVPLKQLRRRPTWATPRTAVAAGLAAAMVLGGGTALFDVSQQSSPQALTPPPLPPGGPQWLDKAKLALASTDTQLRDIDAAQQRWQSVAAGRPSGTVPAEVVALGARKAFLESQRSILASQIAAWQNLQQNDASLSTANAQLAALSQAAGQPGQTSEVQQQLAAQRATLQARSQMLADQARTWQQDIARASTSPMPDTTPEPTTALISRVDDLQKGPKPAPVPVGDRGEGGSVLAGRSPNSGDKERDLPGTAAPPRPDGESTQAVARSASDHGERGGLVAAAGSLTEPLGDTVKGTGLLGGGAGKASDGSSTGRGHGQDDGGSSHGGGLAAPLQHGTERVGGVLGGAVDGLTGGSGAAHDGARGSGRGGHDDGGQGRQGSRGASSLAGTRTVGELVGRALDASRQQQGEQPGRTASSSAVVRIGGTTYRVHATSRSTERTTRGAATAGKTSRTGVTRAAVEREVRSAVTSRMHALVGKQASGTSKGSGSKDSGSKGSVSKGSVSKGLQRLAAAYASKSSGGSSSVKALKERHASSKNYTSSKSSGSSKTAGQTGTGHRGSSSTTGGTVSHPSSKNSGSSSTKGSGTKGSGTKGSGTKGSGSRS